MTYIKTSKNNLTYIGIDESTMSLGKSGLIVAAAETKDYNLTVSSQSDLFKAKDYLDQTGPNRQAIPSLNYLKRQGLETFHWTRANKGRFTRQQIEHAAIAHLVALNGYNPQKTILLIDSYGKSHEMQYHIKECLHSWDFQIPLKNIECHEGGDKSIPIINFADLLAFQAGVFLNRRYKNHFPRTKNFDIILGEIPFDQRRILIPLSVEGRLTLEKIINGKK